MAPIKFFFELVTKQKPTLHRINDLVPTYTSTEFLEAVEQGNAGIVRAYLAANIHNRYALNVVNDQGQSALMLAAKDYHCLVFPILLATPGIRLDQQCPQGKTALMYGVLASNMLFVSSLCLNPRTDLQRRDVNGQTAKDQGPSDPKEHRMIVCYLNAAMSKQFTHFANTLVHPVSDSQFLSAAKTGDDECIRKYIRDNGKNPKLSKLGLQAAELSERAGVAGMTVLIKALIHDQLMPQKRCAIEDDEFDFTLYPNRSQLQMIQMNFEKIPEAFKDGVTNELMEYPITLPSGYTLDRSTLKNLQHKVCPFTRIPFDESVFYQPPSEPIHSEIKKYIAQEVAQYQKTKGIEAELKESTANCPAI